MGILKKGDTDIKLVIKVEDTNGIKKKVEIMLPDIFEGVQNVYHFQVNNDTVLISAGQNNKQINVGVWVYKIKSNILIQKYTDGQQWNSFQMADKDCLIGAHSSHYPGHGVLLYNAINDNITKIYEGTTSYFNFLVIENNYYISGNRDNSGLLKYDINTKTIRLVTNFGTYWTVAMPVGDKYLLGGGEASVNPGLLLLDIHSDSAELIYPQGIWKRHVQVGENYLIANPSGGTNTGILLYKPKDKTATLLSNKSTYWANFIVIGNDCLISSTNSGTNYLGILLYDSTNETITKIYEEGYGWNYNIVINDIVLISSTNSVGILLYNMITKNIIKIYDTGNRWAYSTAYYHKIGENILISSYSSNLGVLEFLSSTNTINKITDTRIINFIPVTYNNKPCCLLSSTSSSTIGIWLYQPNENTAGSISQEYTKNYYWNTAYKIDNTKILIGGRENNATGVLLFDTSKPLGECITQIYSKGTGYKYFIPTNNKVLLVGTEVALLESISPEIIITDKSRYGSYTEYIDTFEVDIDGNIIMKASDNRNKKILGYSSQDETVKLIGWNLGEI